jgi:uncharacterized membrane-anchored protein
MTKAIVWIGFALLVLAQWMVPGRMIWAKEKVLAEGVSYKFQSAPIDPNDPFRGKYIVLNFKETSLTVAKDTSLDYGEKVYVTFSINKEGFAVINSVGKTKPSEKEYLETTINYTSTENDSTTIVIYYPFNKFYMDEYKAPKAEAVYRERNIDTTQKAYALVNLLYGDAVIKDVFINDSSILQIIRQGK